MKRFGLILMAAMLLSPVIFISDAKGAASALPTFDSAAAQTVTARRRSRGLASRTYRGGRYVVRKTWDGTKYVSKKVWVGTKYGAHKTAQGARYTAHKTKGGAKAVFRGTKKVLD